MTAQEIFNHFSESLLQDERILSTRERELLANVLQHARGDSNAHHPQYVAISETISRAVGETVAQRAYEVLGSEILRQVALSEPLPQSQDADYRIAMGPIPPAKGPIPPAKGPIPPAKGPIPPAKGPIPPARGPIPPATGPIPPAKGPIPPAKGPIPPAKGPIPPARGPIPPARGPIPPTAHSQPQSQPTSVAVLEEKTFLPARCVVFDEFLVPEELDRLTGHALDHEADFQISEVISPGVNAGTVDYEARRSHVLMNQDEETAVLTRRIQAFLPRVLQKLGQEVFPVSQVEAQITASNHGDFFYCHTDDSAEEISSRALTFVYFFHREPKAFAGGELRIYDSQRENGQWVKADNCQTIVPEQNRIVFFPSSLVHEITPVECPSQAFADSRLTVNGWFHR